MSSSIQKIVVAGGTSGIGLAAVRLLASRGITVGVAGRNTDVMKRLEAEYPGNIIWERIDITDESAHAALERLIKRLGGMDSYFHVSGIGFENNGLATDREIKTVRTNVEGFTRMVDSAFRYFRDSNGGKGQIAAITSVAGTGALGDLASYSASKCYQQTYMRALDQLARIQGLDIRFTDIRPGWVRTPLLVGDSRYPMLMDVDYAARKAVKALLRQKRVAVIDWRWNIAVGLWRLVPRALWVRLPIRISPLAGRE